MSEKLTHQNHETQKQQPEAAEVSRKNIERIRELAEQEKSVSEKEVEAIRQAVESEAKHSEELAVEKEEAKAQPVYNQRELRSNSYKKTLSKVQTKLPPAERAFSKVIHNKTVETVSEFSGKTIARPSGILGGGLLAAVGSFVALYYAKHTGFEYNYSLLIILYILGFGGGILFEIFVNKTRKSN